MIITTGFPAPPTRAPPPPPPPPALSSGHTCCLPVGSSLKVWGCWGVLQLFPGAWATVATGRPPGKVLDGWTGGQMWLQAVQAPGVTFRDWAPPVGTSTVCWACYLVLGEPSLGEAQLASSTTSPPGPDDLPPVVSSKASFPPSIPSSEVLLALPSHPKCLSLTFPGNMSPTRMLTLAPFPPPCSRTATCICTYDGQTTPTCRAPCTPKTLPRASSWAQVGGCHCCLRGAPSSRVKLDGHGPGALLCLFGGRGATSPGSSAIMAHPEGQMRGPE